MAIEKIKILGAVLELPAWPNFEVNGLDWQCCLAGSSTTASRILIFSIAMGTNCSFYVKSIATCALTFFGYIISVLASVVLHGYFYSLLHRHHNCAIYIGESRVEMGILRRL